MAPFSARTPQGHDGARQRAPTGLRPASRGSAKPAPMTPSPANVSAAPFSCGRGERADPITRVLPVGHVPRGKPRRHLPMRRALAGGQRVPGPTGRTAQRSALQAVPALLRGWGYALSPRCAGRCRCEHRRSLASTIRAVGAPARRHFHSKPRNSHCCNAAYLPPSTSRARRTCSVSPARVAASSSPR